MEGLIAFGFILFFGLVGLAWYGIIRGAAKVVGGAIDIAEDAINRRNANQGRASAPTPTMSAQAPTSQFDHFLSLGPGPDLAQTQDALYRIIRLQTATKACYYYHIGFYSAVANLVSHPTPNTGNNELDSVLNALWRKCQGRTDTPGASQSLALKAGNPNQKPYSSVLWAIENGHTNDGVVQGVIKLVKLQGV